MHSSTDRTSSPGGRSGSHKARPRRLSPSGETRKMSVTYESPRIALLRPGPVTMMKRPGRRERRLAWAWNRGAGSPDGNLRPESPDLWRRQHRTPRARTRHRCPYRNYASPDLVGVGSCKPPLPGIDLDWIQRELDDSIRIRDASAQELFLPHRVNGPHVLRSVVACLDDLVCRHMVLAIDFLLNPWRDLNDLEPDRHPSCLPRHLPKPLGCDSDPDNPKVTGRDVIPDTG